MDLCEELVMDDKSKSGRINGSLKISLTMSSLDKDYMKRHL